MFFFYRQAKDTRKDKKRKKREIGEGNKEERERGTDESLFTIVNVFFGLLFFNEQTEKKEKREDLSNWNDWKKRISSSFEEIIVNFVFIRMYTFILRRKD